MPSKNTNAIILGVLFAGLGHIYLGFKKRGIIWLVGAIAIALWNVFTTTNNTYYSAMFLAWAYWGAQLGDLIKIVRRLKSLESKKQFDQGWETKT